MKKYHKIKTLFERDPATKHKTLLEGQFQRPEFEYLKDCPWEFTEKVDGTNIRIIWHEDELTISGKSDNAQLPPKLLKMLREMFEPHIEQFREEFPGGNTCFYGEGYGPGIQKIGENYRDTPGFILFDVMISELWLRQGNVLQIAANFTLDTVPVVSIGSLRDMVNLVHNGFTSAWPGISPEGLVARPAGLELLTRRGERVITKLKCKDFR